MAHKQEQWDLAKTLFELGKSLNYIVDETGISKGQISKKSKLDKWAKNKTKPIKDEIVAFEKEKETFLAKKETIMQKVSLLSEYEVTIMDNVIQEDENINSLLTSTATLAIIRNNEKLTKNEKTVMLKTVEYDSQGYKSGEKWDEHQVELSTSDIKDIIDSTDKASITLGVNDRHAKPTQIQNNNDNQTQKTIKVQYE